MNKVEALRVGDARLTTTEFGEVLTLNSGWHAPEVGDLFVCIADMGFHPHLVVSERDKPALLAALLDEAGAVKVKVSIDPEGWYVVPWVSCTDLGMKAGETGEFSLIRLPVPEDTHSDDCASGLGGPCDCPAQDDGSQL